MKKLSFLCTTILFGNFLFGQSYTLKSGTLVPINNKAITILPTTPKDQSLIANTPPSANKLVLVGGSMNPSSSHENVLILPNSNSLTYNGSQGTQSLIPAPSNQKSTITKPQSGNTKSLTGNDNASFTPLTDYGTNNTKANNANSTNLTSLAYPTNSGVPPSSSVSLEPLTYVAPKATVQSGVETIDPSRMNLTNSMSSSVSSQKEIINSAIKNAPRETLPPRINISKTKMPELAPIEGAPIGATQNNSTGSYKAPGVAMPELAPIDGLPTNTTSAKTNQSVMPELAPIEDVNTEETKQTNSQNQDLKPENTNRVRGFIIPKGTLLQAKDNKSYIIKPATPVRSIVPFKPNDAEEVLTGKPSAGGGAGFLADDVAEVNDNYTSSGYNTEFFSIKTIKANLVQSSLQSTPTKNKQTQEQLQQAAKNHQHDPNNPCCRVQMSYAAKKKVVKKKPIVYRKKKTYNVSKPVVYAYKADPVKTQNTERIVYVPVQQSQQTQQQPKQIEVYKPEPQKQSAPAQKTQDKVVYRDYTNTYSKGNPSPQSSQCNCPPGSNQSSGGSKDSKSYYNPNNYANGLTSGPTSGDYPVSGNSSDVGMKYTFYVNPMGKYGVSIYNNNCSVLLQQNGKVAEYKVYGDSKTEQPKLNFFGSPESIAGIPIEYNYNRTVHKIGNIKFDYDFEGFFKTVGNSTVQYNSKSSLSKVDNINVKYDAGGNVSSVDQNSGIVQYNP